MADYGRFSRGLSRLNRRRLLQASAGTAAGLGLSGPAFAGATGSRRRPVISQRASSLQSTAQGAVSLWHVWGGDREPLMEDVLADFHEAFPDITVEPTLLSQEGLQERYLTAIAGGDPPDVMQLHTRDLPNFASSGALRGVGDLIESDGINIDETFYPAEAEVSRYQGEMYGLPLAVGGGNFLIYWNKDHFRDAGLDPEQGPATWSELVEFSQALTQGADGDFERLGCLFTGSPTPRPGWFIEWVYCNNGQLYSDDGIEVRFDAAENVEALTWIVDNLNQLYGGWENVRTYLSGSSGAEGNQAFFQGQLSIHLQGIYHFLQLSAEAPDLDYGVTLPPYNDANPDAESAVYVDGNWNYVIPNGAENIDAGWELIKYLCMGEGQLNFFMPQGRPSVVPEYNDHPGYEETNPYWSTIQDYLEISVASPTTEVYAQDMTILAQYVEEAFLGMRSPEEALQVAREEAQNIHDRELDG